MKVTEFTSRALDYRRTVRRWKAEGFEEVDERGGPLWELQRGYRGLEGHTIKEVRITPGGKSLFVRIAR